ncbi:MAG: glycosyltransferase, partial [Planctomycetota bacterium]
MPDAPLLSIVMPTKDRADCAIHAIASILRFKDHDFELIVHDNSEEDTLADAIASLQNDPRLRYFRSREPLSMSQNFERAIDEAAGEYIGALGDDDGVDESVLSVCRWLRNRDIGAMTPTNPVLYYWPGLPAGDTPATHGRLNIRRFTGETRLADPECGLDLCVRRGATRMEGLPCLYHGVVRRRCLEQVRERTGRWLPGVSPDMAAAVAVASYANRIAIIDYPVFVPGASPRSGAGRGVAKTHQGDLKNERFLDADLVATWPEGIPAFFTGPTMWGAAAVQALRATGRDELVAQ